MKITEFGNPILRQKAAKLTVKEIGLPKNQKLIKDIQELLLSKKMGVGLAAPQVGKGLALAVISVRPLKHRKNAKEFDLVIINPEITKTFGKRSQEWEGCISGSSTIRGGLFAKTPRFKKLELKYRDEKGRLQQKVFDGLAAHIIQHEVDHLNGILFVDKVKDRTSFITYREYVKLAKAEAKKKKTSSG